MLHVYVMIFRPENLFQTRRGLQRFLQLHPSSHVSGWWVRARFVQLLVDDPHMHYNKNNNFPFQTH